MILIYKSSSYLGIVIVAIVEITVLILAIIVAILLFKITRTIIHLAVNSVLRFLILFTTNFLFGLQIKITLITILICAFAGVFGAFAIIILNYLKIAFV
jgi:SigmaK-factor processing regulatory protein BofA